MSETGHEVDADDAPSEPPPDAAEPALDAEARACLPALRALCRVFDLEPDARVAMRALSVVAPEEIGAGALPAALGVLSRALPAVGLRAHEGRGAAAELVADARRSGVCVAMSSAPAAPKILAIVRGVGERATVRLIELTRPTIADESDDRGDAIDATPMDAAALTGLFTPAGSDDGGTHELLWITASPALPLGALGPAVMPHDDLHGDHQDGPSPFARLRALARIERDDLWIVLVYAIAVGVLSLATPIAVQALVNTVAFGALIFPVVVLSVLLLAVLTFAGVLNALQMRVVEAIQQRVFTRVALDLAYRIPRVRAEALDRAYGPELVNRFFDVLTVQKSASIFLLDGLGLVLSAAIGMLVLAFYHPILLAFDVVLALSVFALLWGLGRRGSTAAVNESKAKYRVAAWLEDLARTGATFRTPHGAELASSRADELTRAYLGTRRASFAIVFRQYAGVLALQAVATAALLGLGGWLVVERQLTLGQLIAAELIVATVVSSLSKLGRKIDAYYDLLAAVDKLGHLVDLPLERAHGGGSLDARRGPAAVVACELRYAYASGGEVTVPPFTLKAGGRLALAGGAGSGKSTLADILFGLRVPDAGTVEIDGVDVRGLPPHTLRAHVALVRTEDALVVEGTLADNVTLGRPGLGHAEARAALDAVGLSDRVRGLPRGIDTPLAATGAPLGSSDLRHLGIARAIAGAPRLLIVDGGLAGLDAGAREHLLATLTARTAPWSMIVLASPDDPLVGACDSVLSLDAPSRVQLASDGRRGAP